MPETKEHQEACLAYLQARTGRYELRAQRYSGVSDILFSIGMHDDSMLTDVGAGWTEFDYYLRKDRDWHGRYFPVDGAFDGVDLNSWQPISSDYYAALEVIEHLYAPSIFLSRLKEKKPKGIVLTTPNPYKVDVLGMDPTHITPVYPEHLERLGFTVEARSFYGQPQDSLLAWWN